MGSLSIWHILVIVVLVMLLFGRGKVSELMGDVAKGIKNFREGMKDEPKTQQINPPNEAPVQDHVKADGTKV